MVWGEIGLSLYALLTIAIIQPRLGWVIIPWMGIYWLGYFFVCQPQSVPTLARAIFRSSFAINEQA
jgi:hypothetical protein